MMADVKTSLDDADVIILIIDVKEDPSAENLFAQQFVKKFVLKSKKPKLLALNKIDLIVQDRVNELIKNFESQNIFEEVIPISATANFNIQRVKEGIIQFLPKGPKLFPDDQVTDENERFFVSEIIREKILELYRDEVPYSCEVLIADFKEREEGKNFISAEIVVEKDSQKAIIIGKGGTAIKKLGQNQLRNFCRKKCFLS